jgi:hypothetical protein
MQKTEITKTFPVAESQGLDVEIFKVNLSNAICDYLAALSNNDPPMISKMIYRLDEGGFVIEDIKFPNYLPWNPSWAKTTLSAKGIAELMQYAWEKGELRHTLTGPNPQRQSWELVVLYEVIHIPLSKALNEAAIEEAIDEGNITNWSLPDNFFEELVTELVIRHCMDQLRYIARCPLAWIECKPGMVWTLGDGIVLKTYTKREKAGFLTRNHNRLLWQDSISMLISNVAVLEITNNIESNSLRSGKSRKTLGDIIDESIADTIDIVKWALCNTFGLSPLVEGTIIYGDTLGGSLSYSSGAFRREEKNQGTVYELNENAIKMAAELIGLATKYKEQSADLKQAFWYFGRGCLADLDRDVLLDSIIGLEHLLVPNPGETRYRFGLNGAALLSSDPDKAEAKARELRKAYDSRSSAAHGRREGRIDYAWAAHKYLGDIIRIIIDLLEEDIFDPSIRISVQIERAVLRNSPIRQKRAQIA